MQANPRTIANLFNSQLRYIVPMFQRHYVWKEVPQWSNLWEDIEEKANERLEGQTPNSHYLGALIIEGVKPKSPVEVTKFLVIDGQQRLTTIQIVLCALRDYAIEREIPKFDQIITRLLENSDSESMENKEEILKLYPTVFNRAIFESVIFAKSHKVVEERFPKIKLYRKRSYEPRDQIVEAYFYFFGKIKEWIQNNSQVINVDESALAGELLQSIQQDFVVVEISLAENDDEQEIFYSLNSQGQPLSQSDLLRSLIFMRAEKEGVDKETLFAELWKQYEDKFWSLETKRGGKIHNNLDLVLRYFLTVKAGKVIDTRRVNEEYKRWITSDKNGYASIRDELIDFDRHAKIFKLFEHENYYKYGGSEDEIVKHPIFQVVKDLDIKTVIPLIMKIELANELTRDSKNSAYSFVESFLIRRGICSLTNKDYNKFFVEVISELVNIESNCYLRLLKEKLQKSTGESRRFPTDEEVVECLKKRAIYSEDLDLTRLVLKRLEKQKRICRSEENEVPSYLEIEHILPQSWRKYWPIDGQEISEAQFEKATSWYFGEEVELPDELREKIKAREIIKHNIGNLTLLGGRINKDSGNSDFVTKLSEYKASVLLLNREFENYLQWQEENIVSRSEILAKEICKIWEFPSS